MLPDHLCNQGKDFRLGRSVPDRESMAAAGDQTAVVFGKSLSWRPEVQHAEGTDYRVKACTRISDLLGISNFKCCACEAPAGLGQHVLGDVEPDRIGAAPRSFGCDIAGSGCHVEQLCPGPDPHGIEQPVDRATCHLTGKDVVVLSLLAPRGLLKFLKRISLLFADSHLTLTRPSDPTNQLVPCRLHRESKRNNGNTMDLRGLLGPCMS